MIINESLNAQSLRQGQTATQVFTISNDNGVTAKSAIEVQEVQPTDSPILNTFTVDIVTDDETQAHVYGPTTFQELVSHGYTALELLEPHMKRQYRMTFTPTEKVNDSFQDTVLTYTLRIGTEKTVEIATENTVENTVVETPTVTSQPANSVTTAVAQTSSPSQSHNLFTKPPGQVLGTSSAALPTLSQPAQPEQSPSSASTAFLLVAGFLTTVLFASMISILRHFVHHFRSSPNRQ